MTTTLHSDAENGVLTLAKLKAYGLARIDDIDANSGLTPLTAAVRQGHVAVVRLLLDNGADVNAMSHDGRSPLFWATYQRPLPRRSEIVGALLARHPAVDTTCAAARHVTPLMNAVGRLRDAAVARALVDAGASAAARNARGVSARDMAAQTGDGMLVRALRPLSQRQAPATVLAVIDVLVKLLLFVVAWFDNWTLERVVIGVAEGVLRDGGSGGGGGGGGESASGSLEVDTHRRAYGVCPCLSMPRPEAASPQEETTRAMEADAAEEYQDRLTDWVADAQLGRFFHGLDGYLSTVGIKAAALSRDKGSVLSKPENILRLLKLAMYKHVIFCGE
jgi:hypothetical protein